MKARSIVTALLLLLALGAGCTMTWRGSIGLDLEPPPGLLDALDQHAVPNETLTSGIPALEGT